jgi:hypothetical protein
MTTFGYRGNAPEYAVVRRRYLVRHPANTTKLPEPEVKDGGMIRNLEYGNSNSEPTSEADSFEAVA